MNRDKPMKSETDAPGEEGLVAQGGGQLSWGQAKMGRGLSQGDHLSGGAAERAVKTVTIAGLKFDPHGATGFGLGAGDEAAPKPIQQGAGSDLELARRGFGRNEAIGAGLVDFGVDRQAGAGQAGERHLSNGHRG